MVLLLFFLSGTVYGYTQTPVANFTATPQSGCSPLIVSFQDLSSGNPTSWSWDFGNGNTSALQNPSATYITPGTYTIRLTATNAAGSNTITRTSYITVYENPVVNFSANNTSGCFPLRVQFADLSDAGAGNTITSWEWDFGNGVTSVLQNPSATYTTAGLFTVTLTVTNDKGCRRTFVRSNYINVTPGVTAGFTNSTTNVCQPPATINFTNTSTGPGVLSYQWDFGDGGTSALQNPSHIYNTSGSYTITLITTSSAGCIDTFRTTNPIVIGGIITSFNAPASACINEVISLTNTSSPAANTVLWNFGDGTTDTSRNTMHSYSLPGIYTIRVYNTYANCTDSAQQAITINPLPVADFVSPDTVRCQPPLTTNFTDLSTGGATGWEWDFGDGSTSTLQNPSHIYTNPGVYTVRLIVTSATGCRDTIVKTSYIKIQRAVIDIPALPDRGCVPFTIFPVAIITSLDAVTSWLWNFGDGSTSTLQNPSHTYLLQGTYTVKLTITTSTGCTDSLVINNAVRTGTKPIANFTGGPTPVCSSQPVQFTDLSVPADEWLWDFGDGSTSTQQNPTHNYQDTGYFDVTLVAYNNGCPDTVVIPNFVRILPPVALFNAASNCVNKFRFDFADMSIAPQSWLWDFGDGSTSTLQNPTHLYSSLGAFTVTLIVTNSNGCADTTSQTVRTINETPDFNATPPVVCRGNPINFQILNVNPSNISGYYWDFGDGNNMSTTLATVTHFYAVSGSYTVYVVVTDLNGCTDTIRKTNYVRINGPAASFNAVNPSGCAGIITQFNDLSSTDGVNSITNWFWDFGDGSMQNYTSPPFQHLYADTGTFTVKLIVTDAAGCRDSITLANYIRKSDPIPDFFTADSLSCPGALVYFINQSQGNALSYSWDFGDGNTSTITAPFHPYAVTGNFTVKLRVLDAYGCADSLVRNLYVRISLPRASFDISDSISSCTPLQVQFTNTSQFYIASLWDFGGGTSSLTNPVHYFGLPGVYNVKLLVTSRGGCKDSIYKTITVYDTAGSRIAYTPFSGCSPLNANFNVVANGVFVYLWDFGDGNSDSTTVPNASHIYTSYGTYTPKVILKDPTGCLIPLSGIDTIRIQGSEPEFGIDDSLFCDRGTVNFSDSTQSSDPIVSYAWDFGDGGASALTNPVHSYTVPGLYTIRLITTTQSGCMDTVQKNTLIRVVASPVIDITGDTIICINEPILHAGIFLQPDTSVVQWQWSFPNGNASAAQNPPPQTYITAGTFPVTAIAINSSSCKDTAVQNIIVNPLPIATIPAQLTIQNGFPVTIPASYSPNTVSWSWTPASGLSCTNCPTPAAGPKFNTIYTVAFTDNNGCTNNAQVEVIVICMNSNLFIPNTFSPNGDGVNDRFYPRGRGLERIKTLRIFNRWGEVVYEKYNVPVNDASAGWDGTYKGKKPQADVYIYQAEVFCENGELIRLNGNIALIL